MTCKDSDPNSCCGELVYKSECLICSSLAYIAKKLDFRGHIRIRPITDTEMKEFRAPVFYGDNGDLVRGILPVAVRVFWELFLPIHSLYEVHGSRIFPKEKLKIFVKDGNCCFVCLCVMNRHCDYCKAVQKTPKVSSIVANVDAPKRKPFVIIER